jgi:thiamine pyrophosphokinase
VGDLDSIAPATLRWIRRRHIRLQHEREQERSDLEKGLAFARAQGWKRIALVSVLGSRPDHSLFALQLLASTARLDFVVIAKDFIVMPLRGRQSRTFALRHGTALSWLPFARSTGCTLTGVRWPFSARTMTADGFRSLSNEVTGNSVLASQRSGFSWLMISLKT